MRETQRETQPLIEHNLDITPLQVHTKTPQVTTGDWILNIDFWKEGTTSAIRIANGGGFTDSWLGNIRIIVLKRLTVEWRFAMSFCNENPIIPLEDSQMQLITMMPTLFDLIDIMWEFKKETDKFIVMCNDVIVIDVVYNDPTQPQTCAERLSNTIGKISFRNENDRPRDDTASLNFRIKPQPPIIQECKLNNSYPLLS